MDRQRWGRVRELFEAATELPASEWDAWLLRQCGDRGVRDDVLAMLEADRRIEDSGMLPGGISEFIAHYGPRVSSPGRRQR